MEVSKKQKHVTTSGITIHYPALRGVWVNTFLHLKHVYLPSLTEQVNTSRKMNVQCLSSPPVCTEKYPGLTMRSGMLITTHHRKIKMPTCVTTVIYEAKSFQFSNFLLIFPWEWARPGIFLICLFVWGRQEFWMVWKPDLIKRKLYFPSGQGHVGLWNH